MSGSTLLPRRIVRLHQFDKRVPYAKALEWQRRCQDALIQSRKGQTTVNAAGVVFLLEHDPVYTLGRGSKEEFVLDRSIDVVRVERGGEVTYHGPGQLVGYPILDLEHFKKDLHWLLRGVEECIIQSIAEYGIKGERVPGKTGVWVGNSKVAAVGLAAKQWVTLHGFALNVSPECLPGFTGIVPCGISRDAGGVTCMNSLVGTDLKISAVRDTVIKQLQAVFDMDLCYSGSQERDGLDWFMASEQKLSK